MTKVRKAVIPAAGLGTRFLPATKAMAKEMMPIVDTPSIQYVVEEAMAAGIEEIIIISGKGKSPIEDHFDVNIALEENLKEKGKTEMLELVQKTNIPHIHYVRQAYPHGLGDAILQAEAFIGNEPFVVLLGDDIMPSEVPLAKALMDTYDETKGGVVATMRIPEDMTNRYGIIDIKEQVGEHIYSVNHFIEKPAPEEAPSNLAIIGRYLLTPEIFDILRNQAPDAGNEIQLTDAMLTLAKRQDFAAFPFAGKTYDTGAKDGFILANLAFALERADIRPLVEAQIMELVGKL